MCPVFTIFGLGFIMIAKIVTTIAAAVTMSHPMTSSVMSFSGVFSVHLLESGDATAYHTPTIRSADTCSNGNHSEVLI